MCVGVLVATCRLLLFKLASVELSELANFELAAADDEGDEDADALADDEKPTAGSVALALGNKLGVVVE